MIKIVNITMAFFLAVTFSLFSLLQDSCSAADTTFTILNQDFTGIWRGKIPKERITSECVFCTQSVPECSPNQILVPQACTECAHCEDASSKNTSKNVLGKRKSLSAILSRFTFKGSGIIKLKLCVKGKKLEGTVHLSGVIDNAIIMSHSLISKNKVFIVLRDEHHKTKTLTLELLNEKQLTVTFPESDSYQAKKVSLNNKCSILNDKSSYSFTNYKLCPIHLAKPFFIWLQTSCSFPL